MAISEDVKLESTPKKRKDESDDDDFVSEEEDHQKRKRTKKGKEEEEDDQGKKRTKKGKAEEAKEVRWVGAEEFHKSAVSKQMRKCFEVFEKFQQSGGKKEVVSKQAKKKEGKVDSNQKPISSFFTAKKN